MSEKWNLEQLSRAWTQRGLDRRELMKLIGAGAGLSAMTTLFTAPGAGAAAAQQEGEAQVSIEWRKPQTLNPIFSTAGFEQQVERAILGSLVRMSDKLEPTGDLAEKIDVSDDATVYTFHLQPKATFNDGTPLTSADVIFTFERALDKRVGSIWTGRLQGIKGAAEYGDQRADTVEGLSAPDDHTVVFTLSHPDAAFLAILADFCGLGILPKHILGDVAPDQLVNDKFNLAPTVGAGAYKFVQYASDQYVELEANDTYWGGRPAVDRLFLRIVDAEVAVAEIEKGTIDLISVSIDDMERLQQNENLTVVSVPSPSMDSISFNLDLDYFKDKRIRQAATYAIDRENIVKEIYKGNAIVRNSPIFGPEWMGIPEGLNEYPYDPDKAKQLLSDAGWDSGRKVQMMYNPAGNKSFNNMIPIIQAQLGEVGMQIELVQYDAAEINKHLVTDHDYEIYIGGGGVYGADPNISSKYYLSNGFTPTGGNSVWYANPEVDALYEQGREAGDQAKRKEIYTQLAQLLNEECPSVFLWSPNTNFAFNKRLKGFLPPAYVDNRLWNSEQWSVEEG
ncbi:MAG TPA: ABC transporter substrate-binding protein [Thermomicrobiales bacterium]|nr:ABC transporter substrate-binding protein [Thermomicrobiales bacterium]